MWKNYNWFNLTVILFIVLPIFNLQVHASALVSSDKHSKTNILKTQSTTDGLLRNEEDSNKRDKGKSEVIVVEPSTVPLLLNLKDDNKSAHDYSLSGKEGESTGTVSGSRRTNNDSVSALSGKMASAMFHAYSDGSSAEVENNNSENGQIGMKMPEFRNLETDTEEDNNENTQITEFNNAKKKVPEFSDFEFHANENSNIRRSLKAGDIFTPHELLPVTERLLKKVDLPPGTGRGIVSSSKNPEDLADRIFAAYFLTMKRIVILKAEAIVGLDALQALAIEGDPEDFKYMVRTMSRFPQIVIRHPDKEIEAHLPPKRSRYKLLTKKETKSRKAAEVKLAKQKRRQLLKQLQKKMPKNRHLIVNPNDKKHKRQPKRQSLRKALLEPGCTWRYECRDPRDLDSCHLQAKCDNETLSNGHMDEIVKRGPEEEERVPDSFRRAVGVSVIDEEVEKIIENHVLFIRPENLRQNNYHLESVEQYFNMLMARHTGFTTPLTPSMSDRGSKEDNAVNSDSLGYYNGKKSSEKNLYYSLMPFGVPFRKNNGLTSTLNPKLSKSVNKSKISKVNSSVDQSRDATATPRIVKLFGKG